MKIKITHIALALFLVDLLILIINVKYQDEIPTIIRDLDYAKFFFYLGIVGFVIYLIIAKFKKALAIVGTMTIFSLCIAIFFKLSLAKDNYAESNLIREYLNIINILNLKKG